MQQSKVNGKNPVGFHQKLRESVTYRMVVSPHSWKVMADHWRVEPAFQDDILLLGCLG